MGVRDHKVFKVVISGTIAERVETGYMETEATGRRLPVESTHYVVAEEAEIVRAYFNSGSRVHGPNKVESIEEFPLRAIIITEPY